MKKNIFIYTFYRFKDLKKLTFIKKQIKKFAENKLIYGTLLIAKEGINGTISGTKNDLDEFIINLKKIIKIRKLSTKISKNQFIPFYRLKIKLKNEIVTIGNEFIKPEKLTGKYISPKDWDKIINNKKFMIIDTRNNYEINIGTFKNSINPKIKTFRDFPKYIKEKKIKKDQPIAMFCTGGIRCEKATSYLLQNGFLDICQLEGGILNYLEFKKNKKNSSWIGECFVFDNRVSINQKLQKGNYDQCFGCRHPISEEDKQLKSYKKGISCKYCFSKRSEKQINSSATRQSQIDFAEKNKINHNFKKIYIKS
tara:strand:+ start:686 stop:1615 length:930 start_codon:yes stop_codon:yes gene_type:complete